MATGRSSDGWEVGDALVHKAAINASRPACIIADNSHAGIVRCRAGALVGLAMMVFGLLDHELS